ncbi:gliding motility lipoprotein GldH [Chryseobacterium sp. POL2]|uniref:gliding motility lipoprotein GldH n=1 Tax=Chryseobacterium sp. POL2 TaxID=2713414 RepID=UPI0013E1308F|nr:gliding motility lipoprotein GldH [Chryseobacterium sp. POL2]QIG89927.1 gliding motility lipoprotein GldH [Chryseobacterium sp. POL2]
MRKFLGIMTLVLIVFSCSNPDEVIAMQSLDKATWAKNKMYELSFDVQNHQTPKNIIFVIRNNDSYPYSNLRLIGTIFDDTNKVLSKDTLNYVLAKPNGQWLGSGFGDTKEIMFQYKTDFKFPKDGKYSIGVIQAMRNDQLAGIEDVGVKIVNVKP